MRDANQQGGQEPMTGKIAFVGAAAFIATVALSGCVAPSTFISQAQPIIGDGPCMDLNLKSKRPGGYNHTAAGDFFVGELCCWR